MAITTQQYLEQLQLDKKNILSSLSDLGVDVPENATFTDVPDLVRASQNVVEVESKDVNYYDFDGTLLYSYTEDEFLSLTEHPPLKTKPGFTPQAWNWTLEDAKAYVQETGLCDIGINCRTEDNKTRIHIDITNEYFMEPTIGLSQSVAQAFEVDWGDGSPAEISDLYTNDANATANYFNLKHKYSELGKYTITFTPLIEGATLNFNGNGNIYSTVLWDPNSVGISDIYRNYIVGLELGSHALFKSSAFYKLSNLHYVNLPAELKGAFCYCATSGSGIKAYVVPPNSAAIGHYQSGPNMEVLSIPPISVTSSFSSSISTKVKRACLPSTFRFVISSDNMERIGVPSFYTVHPKLGPHAKAGKMPSSITSLDANFMYGSYAYTEYTIPSQITKVGTGAFSQCKNLYKLVFNDNITEIPANCGYESKALTEVKLPSGITSIGSSAFSSTNIASINIPETCTSLSNRAFMATKLASIDIPNDCTSFGEYCFYSTKLTEIDIPVGTTIIPNCFLSNTKIANLELPSTITTLNDYAFGYMDSLKLLDLRKIPIVPVAGGKNVFYQASSDLKVAVTTDLYDSYVVATNWTSFIKYLVAFDSEGNLKVRLNISNTTLLDETPVPLTLSLTDSEGNSIEITESETYAGQAWLSPGTYTLTANAEGYETKEFTITAVDKGLTQSITLVASEGIDEGVDIT